MGSNTTNHDFYLPETGETDWGAVKNEDWQRLDTELIRKDSKINRPDPGTEGRWFLATDERAIYYDDGEAWRKTSGVNQTGETFTADAVDTKTRTTATDATLTQSLFDDAAPGVLYLPSDKTYTVESPIAVPSGLTVVGDAERTRIDGTVGHTKIFEEKPSGVSDVTFRDLTFVVPDGADTSANHGQFHCFGFYEAKESGNSNHNLRFENLMFVDQTTSDNYSFALQIHQTDLLRIRNCTMKSWMGYPIEMERGSRAIVEGCDITSNYYGVTFGASQNETIVRGNQITGESYAIRTEGVDHARICDNHIYDTRGTAAIGLIYSGSNPSNHVTVSNNTIDRVDATFQIAGPDSSRRTSDVRIQGNVVTGATSILETNANTRDVAVVDNSLTGTYGKTDLRDGFTFKNNHVTSGTGNGFNNGRVLRVLGEDVSIAGNTFDVTIEDSDRKSVVVVDSESARVDVVNNNMRVVNDDGSTTAIRPLRVGRSVSDVRFQHNTFDVTGDAGGSGPRFADGAAYLWVTDNRLPGAPEFVGSPENLVERGNMT